MAEEVLENGTRPDSNEEDLHPVFKERRQQERLERERTRRREERSSYAGSNLDTTSVADSTVSAAKRPLDKDLAKSFDDKMRGMSTRIKELGDVFAPWNVVDNRIKAKQVAQILEKDRAQMTEMMNNMMEAYKAACQEAADARMALADKAEQEKVAAQHAERMEKANQELREFKRCQSSNVRNLLQRVDSISVKSSAPQQTLHVQAATPDEEAGGEQEMLQERVETLLAEHERLAFEADKAIKARVETERKFKELQAKAADDNEVKTREIKQLQSAIKKLEERKEAEVAAAKKEVAEQLEKRRKEVELMQRRLNSSKVEVDGLKAREKASKAQLEEAHAAVAKAHEDLKTIKGRLADARSAKEDVLREVKMVQYEANIVADEYRELIQSIVQTQGFEALPCAKYFVKHTAPFPRTAFTLKGGKVLYNRAVHAEIDVSKVVPRDYRSHRQLQEMMAEEGLVLDKQCGVETF